ncbi:AAA family ATPase [Campylobacter sp. RM12920]|uniref:AAA family ATPase n=1 Tax=Campylobacter californiensis TaxID=1032243 RepID=A0ABD4JI79_9BACT|nr:AAA family ATPase [Campylobacter sp. RM12919]MBE2988403.1 AAA family ATPase [Campylobacter sp. RM12920]
MKINNLAVKYFKAYEYISLDFKQDNCLIYGENGTGKSSLYEALHSVFYYDNIKNISKIDINEYYKNRNYKNKDIEISLDFDNGEKFNIIGNKIEKNDFIYYNKDGRKIGDKVIFPNFYFANEKILDRFVKENFYITLKDTLLFYFIELSSIASSANEEEFKHYRTNSIFNDFKDIESFKKRLIDRNKKPENETEYAFIRRLINQEISKQNKYLKFLFDHKIPLKEINEIIKDKFKEKFTISFDFEEARLEYEADLKFIEPVIKIKIDDISSNGKLYHHFNEAKLKIISVAIFFALAKKYETKKTGGLKLLVLDDFLSSLDMANRKYIMQYIFDEFRDYQKIILTHNIHFFNLIIKLTSLNNENNKWEFKKTFIFNNKPEMYSYKTNYIQRAQDELKNGNLDTTANLLRKEFERICAEFEELLQIGKKEELKHIIDKIKSGSEVPLYKAYQFLNNFIDTCKQTIKSDKSSDEKISQIEKFLNSINKSTLKLYNNLQKDISENEFLKNTILNPSSHYDIETEIYQKECEDAIIQLEKLNKKLESIKGNHI